MIPLRPTISSLVIGSLVFVITLIVQSAAKGAEWPTLRRSVRASETHDSNSSEFWNNLGTSTVHKSINLQPNLSRAKNVILFLGDGMSITTITAARIFYGQLGGKPGEEGFLPFEEFPNVALVKTYNEDSQVPDSAGTATAFLTGVKGNIATLGVNPRVRSGEKNCKLINDNSVPSIMKWAQEAGKSTGVVTTARVTHATPAGSYAHVSHRDYESDDQLPKKLKESKGQCKDIAAQLVLEEPGRNFRVIMGGGRRHFLTVNESDPRNASLHGQRTDKTNLIDKWMESRRQEGLEDGKYTFVNDSQGLDAIDRNKVDYLLGLFSHSHMEYEPLRDKGPQGEPSLSQMTEKAIDILEKNPKGFVLLVEGARIDHAHHDNYGALALHETVQFAKAIEYARKRLPSEDTLIVVTADHAHTFTINGNPKRGSPILGFAENDTNNVPFTTLMYGNGPGHVNDEDRAGLTEEQISDLHYRQQSAVYLEESNHGGEDVAVYADGPMAHMVRGVQDQTFVAHAMMAASCIGHYSGNSNLKHCNSGASLHIQLPLIIFALAIAIKRQLNQF